LSRPQYFSRIHKEHVQPGLCCLVESCGLFGRPLLCVVRLLCPSVSSWLKIWHAAGA
jgi:hypothetical protein